MAYQNKLWDGYKSQGERRIAAYLKDQGIRFTYERPVAVIDGEKTKIWYADFHLDDYHILLEYLGMNGNLRNSIVNDYKRRVYKENRYDLIEIYPEDFKRNWQERIRSGIHDTLERRLKDYTSKYRHDPKSKTTEKPYGQMSFGFYR